VVALNLLSRSPAWLTSLHAAPMYLGLDLRGGVHFMLQVDMQAALTKKAESLAGDLRLLQREKSIRHSGINRNAQSIEIRFRDSPTLQAAKNLIQDQFPDLQTTEAPDGTEYRLTASIKPEAARRIQDQALKQNIVTLHNRINELGVGVTKTRLDRRAVERYRIRHDFGVFERLLNSGHRCGVHLGGRLAAGDLYRRSFSKKIGQRVQHGHQQGDHDNGVFPDRITIHERTVPGELIGTNKLLENGMD
jgi:hypothetical protein